MVEEWSVLEWAESRKDGGNCEMKATRLDAESWAKGVVGVFGGIGESRCTTGPLQKTRDQEKVPRKGPGNRPPTLYNTVQDAKGMAKSGNRRWTRYFWDGVTQCVSEGARLQVPLVSVYFFIFHFLGGN